MIPIKNNVLVKPLKGDGKTKGGLFLPENFMPVSNKVIIVEVGEGTKGKPMKLKKNQIAYRVKDWGTEMEINGEKHYLMDQSAIIALQ